ncbi:aldehyde dehydrogenase [Hypoxylon fragiforme]|uniref:aldehyde dehydrogenase n=1 Tax=Hypoxylon fragiforme TaxID=63214 RepID=UPI0020C70381|nr:aldehyde dehydrogenase [Hypoxylon fragiforme]KAI2602907.1 aldehyde dehydrogenase [Hypoxylon fragiforme]
MTPVRSSWVGGKEIRGETEPLPVIDPATGKSFALYRDAGEEDVDRAVALAQEVYVSGVWSKSSRHHRADVLDKCASLLTEALPELIALEVQQTGRVVREMKAQVPSLVRWFKYYASLLRVEEQPVLPTTGKLHNFVQRVPLGVVVLITPFNHPLLIAVKKIAPALAAGNSVIVKPSELTPLTTLRLGPILKEAGVPDGVFNVLPGFGATTGKYLVQHPLVRKVDVTGGTPAGRAIGAIVGGNLGRYTAELGGKAPLVVFDSADIQLAVNGIAFGSFIASGQTCIASTRIIVDNKILPDLLVKLRIKTDSITQRMGAPSNPESMMGPLISETQLSKVETLVYEALQSGDAIAIVGGDRMRGTSSLDGTDFSAGYFYEPTVLVSGEGGKESILKTRIWREEAFGPVIVVVGFDTEDEAIKLANDSEFGLGAGIWTQDLAQAFRVSEQIEAGITWVNTHHRNDPSSPWGGAKSSSGVGSENGIDAYHAYTTTKSTIINYASTEESIATDDWFAEGANSVRYG